MLLVFENVKKIYLGQRRPVLDNISLEVGEGEFIGLTGRSGSGKSSFLNLAAGMMKPTGGRILFQGRELTKMNDRELSEYRNRKIGYIPQGKSLLHNLTVIDNVRLPYYLSKDRDRTPEDITDRAFVLLKQVGLDACANQYPANLSGGEQRRVAIARALINDPYLILADEPTGDLDAETAKWVMRLFSQLAENGTAILMSTHDTDVLDCCSRHVELNSGVLITFGHRM